MGYTHYWRQDKGPANDAQWNAICVDFRHLLSRSPVNVRQECDLTTRPDITDQMIRFNGVGGDGHETMVLEKIGPGFNFCKTARKPYDLLVTALLILANHHAPDVWKILSDGDAFDWQPALTWMNEIGPTQYSLPATFN